MKQKRNDLFCLIAVIVGVLGSALLLRVGLSGSLEAYSAQVQTSAQGEPIRPPLQAEYRESSVISESGYGESSTVSSSGDEVEATPDPLYRQDEDAASEIDGFLSSPMVNDVYLAGYISSQRVNAEIMDACYNRYGQYPLSIEKSYMESFHSVTGYAWYGVAQMPEEVPVIFHYEETSDIWTQRNAESIAYDFFDKQTDAMKSELQRVISNFMDEWSETGFKDWEYYD